MFEQLTCLLDEKYRDGFSIAGSIFIAKSFRNYSVCPNEITRRPKLKTRGDNILI
jgi:hypothetical protein